MARFAAAALAIVLGALALPGCIKKNKPPPMDQIALGGRHGCGQLAAGGVTCWGDNVGGQVGDGTRAVRPWPVTVAAVAGRVSSLALGARHSCVLHEGGSVRCWGAGQHGQLGTGRLEDALAPVPALGDGYDAIFAGGDHTCGRGKAGLLCWGANANGELDQGSTDPRPAPIEPPVVKGARAVAVALGEGHACFALERGEPKEREVRCAGRDAEGQTARGEALLAGVEIAGLAVGAAHSCALTRDGRVFCWGAGGAGQLGNGATSDSPSPVAVAIPVPVDELRSGLRHTCARLRAKVVMCWGDNDHHQLANGTTAPSASPLPVFGLVRVTALAASDESTCARLEDGAVRCWGANARGELGDGTTVEHDVPMPVKAAPLGR